MNDGKISIKRSDIIGDFIIPIPVEDFSKISLEYLPGLVDVEVELQRVEVSCCDDDFELPVLECLVVILLCDCNSFEKGHVGHVDILLDQEFVQIDKFYLHDFNWPSALGPFEVDEEHAVSELCNDETIDWRVVGEDELSVADESWSSGPVDGMLKIVSLNDFDDIEHLRVEGIVIHSHDDNAALSVHLPGVDINIDNREQVLFQMQPGSVLGSRVKRSIYKRLERGERRAVEINFSEMFTCR